MVFPGLVFFSSFFFFWHAEEEFVLALHPSCRRAARRWLYSCIQQLLLKGDIPPMTPDQRWVCSPSLFQKVSNSNSPKEIIRGSQQFPLHSQGQVQLLEKDPSI